MLHSKIKKKNNLWHSLIFFHLILNDKDFREQSSTKAPFTNFRAQMV